MWLSATCSEYATNSRIQSLFFHYLFIRLLTLIIGREHNLSTVTHPAFGAGHVKDFADAWERRQSASSSVMGAGFGRRGLRCRKQAFGQAGDGLTNSEGNLRHGSYS